MAGMVAMVIAGVMAIDLTVAVAEVVAVAAVVVAVVVAEVVIVVIDEVTVPILVMAAVVAVALAIVPSVPRGKDGTTVAFSATVSDPQPHSDGDSMAVFFDGSPPSAVAVGVVAAAAASALCNLRRALRVTFCGLLV